MNYRFIVYLFLSTCIFSLGAGSASAEYNICSVSGSVRQENASPVNGASVFLMQAADSSVIASVTSDSLGRFAFRNVAPGNYMIKVSHVAFENFLSPPFTVEKDFIFPAIQLAGAGKMLHEMRVTAARSNIRQEAGKTVINIENSILAAGNSIMEILDKLPGITVSRNAEIRLSGKQGVNVMIDGKQIFMSGEELASMLRGIAASSVEKIELLTNPSSRFEASGNAGIINIRLKKEKRNGFNSNVTISYVRSQYSRPTANVNVNYKINRLNLFGTYSFIRRNDFNNLDIDRRFFIKDTLSSSAKQITRMRMFGRIHNARIGADYHISAGTVIGMAASGFWNNNNRVTKNTSEIFDPNNELAAVLNMQSDSPYQRFNPAVNVNVRHAPDTSGKLISLDLDYALYSTHNDQHYETEYSFPDNNAPQDPYLLFGKLRGALELKSFKLDFTQPFGKSGLAFESGMKNSLVNSESDIAFFDRSNGGSIPDLTRTNSFTFRENISAAYVNITSKKTRINWETGARLEYTATKGTSVSDAATINRRYFQLFPSIRLDFKAGSGHQLGVYAGRRIDRPLFNAMNPFRYYINESTYYTGNPFLKPQITTLVEASHVFDGKITTKFSYSRTKDYILNLTAQDEHAKEVVVETSRNITGKYAYNFSVSGNFKFGNWVNANSHVQVYYNRFKGLLFNTSLNAARVAFNLNCSGNIVISETISAEISGVYQSAEMDGFLHTGSYRMLAAGIQKHVLAKKGNIKLSINDAFYTASIHAVSASYGYRESYFQRMGTRYAALSFSWRLGNSKTGPFPKKQGGAEQEKKRI